MNRRSRLAAYNTIFGARPLTASYVGPFDGITFAALYGLKRFLTAYTGPLIRLRRNSDNAEDDFYPVSDTGLVDQEAIDDFLGVASPFMPTWYDQSGNGRNATQATAGSQPAYVASGVNGLPVVRFDGSDDWLEKTGLSLSFADPCLVATAKSNAIVNNDGFVSLSAGGNDWDNGNSFYFAQITSPTRLEFVRTGLANVASMQASYASGTWHTITGTQIDGNGALRFNGGAAAASDTYTDTAASPTQIRVGRRYAAGTLAISADMTLIAVLDGLSAANHNTIGNELATLYGLTWNTVS